MTRVDVSRGSQNYETNPEKYPLNEPIPKLEAQSQCTGEAEYIGMENNFDLIRPVFLSEEKKPKRGKKAKSEEKKPKARKKSQARKKSRVISLYKMAFFPRFWIYFLALAFFPRFFGFFPREGKLAY